MRSTKSPAGAVQTAQWRELDLSSSRAPAEFPAVMPSSGGSRNFVPRPLAVEPPPGGKIMRAARPQTPRQVKVTCTPANKFAVIINKNSLVQIQRTCTRIFSGKSMKSAIQTQNSQSGKKNGANHRIRTDDLLITNELLYRLS